MKAILTCVDYGDILALTLPYNRHHFTEVVVVTTPADEETQQVAQACNATLHVTPDFYLDGAPFNKWVPLEQGLDILGRDGLICIMDADIAWPKSLPQINWQPNIIYSPRRRIHLPLSLPPEKEWGTCPLHPVAEIWAGYTQIFHGTDTCLPKPPWHQSHSNAGGPDTVFQNRWKNKQRLPFEVLHIGPTETNWGGRITPKADGSIVPGAEERAKQIENIKRRHKQEFRKHL